MVAGTACPDILLIHPALYKSRYFIHPNPYAVASNSKHAGSLQCFSLTHKYNPLLPLAHFLGGRRASNSQSNPLSVSPNLLVFYLHHSRGPSPTAAEIKNRRAAATALGITPAIRIADLFNCVSKLAHVPRDRK